MPVTDSSQLDNVEIKKITEQMGIVADFPVISEAASQIGMVLLACGDKDGFAADTLIDAIGSINAFMLECKMRPADFIIKITGGDKALIADQIEALQTFIEK